MKPAIPLIVIISFISTSILSGCNNKNPSIIATEDINLVTQEDEIPSTPTSLNYPSGVLISEIQGKSHRSMYEGENVENIYGIVTVKKSDGFYMQDPSPDNDSSTSDGIYVSIRGVPRVDQGDKVWIKNGTVREFNPAGIGENSLTITQIITTSFEVISKGNQLPSPEILGEGGRKIPNQIIDDDIFGFTGRNGVYEPDKDGIDFFESLESMLVQVNEPLAISATSHYKEIAVLADNGKDAGILSPRSTLILQETDQNPERILLDDAFIMMPDVNVGARINEPIVGVVDYTFGNYKILPLKKFSVTSSELSPEKFQYELIENQISIASYNVENLDAQDNPQRLEILADHIINYLNSPDIVGFQEIQDDDGEIDSNIVSADQSFQRIIDAIQISGGPKYEYINIDPIKNRDGGAPGGNIRVGFIYRTDRGLTLIEGEPGQADVGIEIMKNNEQIILSNNPGRIDPESYAFQSSRKPLVAGFKFNEKNIYVVVNHLNSKGGDGPLFGDIQPPNLESETQRIMQAEIINSFVKSLLEIDEDAYVVVLGDLNDFPWSKPIKTLEGDELINLINLLPVNEQYSYIYDGNAQVLDHILISYSLKEKVSIFDIVHINSDFYYENRLSDHDPLIAVFTIN